MWVPRIYQTDNMEAAFRYMVEANRNVLVYSRYMAIRPIRIRLNLVRDIPIELCIPWQPFSKYTIARWQENGGAMVYRTNPRTFRNEMPACDAMLIIECPFQIDDFERITKDVKQEVVVYRPPTWELHAETINHFFPSAETYVTLEAIFAGFVGRTDLEPEMEGVMAISPYPRETTAVFTAWDIERLTGWKEKFLRMALKYRYYGRLSRYHIYSTRMGPDDKEMRWAYNILKEQPQVSPDNYAMRFDKPKEGLIYGFKKMLKKLCWDMHVEREDSIYLFNTEGKPLEIDRIDAVNNMRRARWYKLRNLVDDAPEYDYGQD